MTIAFKKDIYQDHRLHTQSKNINRKYIISTDKENTNDDSNVKLQNEIHDKYVEFIKKDRKMNYVYFKNILTCVFQHVYKTPLKYNYITQDKEIQDNIIKILNDTSFFKIYEILKHYSNDEGKNIIEYDSLIDLTALFFSSLNFFISNKYNKY